MHHARPQLRWLLMIAVITAVCASLTRAGAEPGTAEPAPNAEVLPPGATVRVAPDELAPVTGTLTPGTKLHVVVTQRGAGGEWAVIVLPSGEKGFIREQHLVRLLRPPSWRETPHIAKAVAGDITVVGNRVSVKLRRDGGVFLVRATINGQAETLLVLDTGASDVVLTETFAGRLGIAAGPPRRVLTANGTTVSRPTLLESIHVPDQSGVEALRVPASVSELPGFPSHVGGLLGQTFLRHFRVSVDAENYVLHLDALR